MYDLQSEAKAKIWGLIEKFEREKLLGTLDQYNEAGVKVGFIEPFFQALGWNTCDRNEVSLQEKVSGGRVDYALKIRGSSQILDPALLSKKLERERVPVDKAFLTDLERWRELLAKNLYKRLDFSLDADCLREATQRLLDRIIFIRSCEDRKLTHTESLRDLILQRRDDIGSEFTLVLKSLFRRYDRDFNSEQH